MEQLKVQIIEDDEDIAELLKYNLKSAGYEVFHAANGEEGLAAIYNHKPHVILLDLMLPGVTGLDICHQVKRDESTSQIPILMLTAKSEEKDIIDGLEAGADDYITKPFSPKVLIARMKTVLRRQPRDIPVKEGVLKIHGLEIDSGKRNVVVAGSEVNLTFTEFQILHMLARRPGWVFTRSQIVNSVNGLNHAVTDRAVDVHIVGLRKKLGELGKLIETVRVVGYRFKENQLAS